MQSKAESVDGYLDEVPEERRQSLEKLRALCLEILDGYEESMEYGMPGYKNYISLYVLKQDVFDANRELLSGLNLGKGCIRYRKPEQIDFSVVRKLLAESKDSGSEIC